MSIPSLNQSFVTGFVETAVGRIPRVAASLTWKDRLGSYKARWDISRMHYTVEPGLYALGQPRAHSPVVVTANYKMSFDRLREELEGIDTWIMVLDTKGINVWCAAGKGTFGTAELVARIESSGLSRIVEHKQLILPQLSAPGVSAHQVKKLSGFKVIYGPIRASDLRKFIAAGFKASPGMREKTFTIYERMVLIPVELVSALRAASFVLPVVFLTGGLAGNGGFWANTMDYGLPSVLALLSAIVSGSVLTPLLLPWLPGRAFSSKGLAMGLMNFACFAAFQGFETGSRHGRFQLLTWLFVIPAINMYLAMNFTGASTYTSLSGVKKEMRWALPIEIGAGGLGILFWLLSLFLAWR